VNTMYWSCTYYSAFKCLRYRHRLAASSAVAHLCRWSYGLDWNSLPAWSPPEPNARLWLFQVKPEDTLVFAVLDTQRTTGIA